MRYYLIALSIGLSGCATVSEYNQGCRDGISEIQPTVHILPWPFTPPPVMSREQIEATCNELEAKKRSNQDRPRGRLNQ